MKRITAVIFFACSLASFAQTNVVYRQVTWTSDVTSLQQQIPALSFNQGDALQLDNFARYGKTKTARPVDLTGTNVTALFWLASKTNSALAYLTATGSVVDATNGHTRFYVNSPQMSIEPNEYSSYAMWYQSLPGVTNSGNLSWRFAKVGASPAVGVQVIPPLNFTNFLYNISVISGGSGSKTGTTFYLKIDIADDLKAVGLTATQAWQFAASISSALSNALTMAGGSLTGGLSISEGGLSVSGAGGVGPFVLIDRTNDNGAVGNAFTLELRLNHDQIDAPEVYYLRTRSGPSTYEYLLGPTNATINVPLYATRLAGVGSGITGINAVSITNFSTIFLTPASANTNYFRITAAIPSMPVSAGESYQRIYVVRDATSIYERVFYGVSNRWYQHVLTFKDNTHFE